MEHEDSTSRPADDRRAWLPFLVIGVAVVIVLTAVLLVVRGDDSGDAGDPDLSLPAAAPTTTTIPATTVPATTTTAPVATTIPPPVVPPETGAPGGPVGTAAPARDAQQALDELDQQAFVSFVTDAVRVRGDSVAMAVVAGDIQFLRWDGEEWQREDIVDAPSSVRDIDTADVTGDGVTDFVIRLSGIGDPGGVYGRDTFRFELLPFNTGSGTETWVDDLRLQLGQLVSDIPDGSGRGTVEWTWTGRQFEVLA